MEAECDVTQKLDLAKTLKQVSTIYIHRVKIKYSLTEPTD